VTLNASAIIFVNVSEKYWSRRKKFMKALKRLWNEFSSDEKLVRKAQLLVIFFSLREGKYNS
jgi:hypothetical protein